MKNRSVQRNELVTAAGSTNCKDEERRSPQTLSEALKHQEFLDELAAAIRGMGGEDLLGETLLRLIQLDARGRYHPSRGRAMAYAIGVARRVQPELARTEARQARPLQIPLRSVECPEEALVCKTINEAVRYFVGILRPADQLVIRRRFWEPTDGKRWTSADRARLSRAKARLREMVMNP